MLRFDWAQINYLPHVRDSWLEASLACSCCSRHQVSTTILPPNSEQLDPHSQYCCLKFVQEKFSSIDLSMSLYGLIGNIYLQFLLLTNFCWWNLSTQSYMNFLNLIKSFASFKSYLLFNLSCTSFYSTTFENFLIKSFTRVPFFICDSLSWLRKANILKGSFFFVYSSIDLRLAIALRTTTWPLLPLGLCYTMKSSMLLTGTSG